MKTDVILYRPMGDFEVQQRTKDGFFNASNLAKQWNLQGKSRRDIGDFLKSKKADEFIRTVIDDANRDSTIVEHVDYEDIVKDVRVKNLNGKWEREVFLHPYVFIKFAMFLSPSFELQVIKFVYDQLIQHRHKAGDNYRLLTASASIFPNVNYPKIAQGLNWIVFNKHHKEIRNTATEAQMQELHQLEEKLAFAVDMGYINSYGQLINEMRKLYHSKNNKF